MILNFVSFISIISGLIKLYTDALLWFWIIELKYWRLLF